MLMYYGSKENVGGKMLDEIIMQMKSHGTIYFQELELHEFV
jgi:hypothetical protein